MKTKDEGLQKFTDPDVNEIKMSDTRKFLKTKFGIDENNYDKVIDIIDESFATLKGQERDEFIRYTMPLFDEDTKNQIWEYNHFRIICSISDLMQTYGRMPSKAELADNTGLSRQTIHKHLKNYTHHPLYQMHLEKFGIIAEKVLAKVFYYAVNGDMKAAKLFFDVLGKNIGAPQNNFIQNSFVQINQFKLSQEQIKQLSPEKLNEIESIIKDILPETND